MHFCATLYWHRRSCSYRSYRIHICVVCQRHKDHILNLQPFTAFVNVETSGISIEAPQNGSKVFAMRHGVKKARLGRPADQRKALVRGLVTEVLRHGKIKTTKVRNENNVTESLLCVSLVL